jgi:hypothetical protein
MCHEKFAFDFQLVKLSNLPHLLLAATIVHCDGFRELLGTNYKIKELRIEEPLYAA